MEWSAPGIVLSATQFGEGDALAAIFTHDHGVFKGLARGGSSRAKSNIWQAGNLVEAKWLARLADQLGSFSAELVHPAAALAMQDPIHLAVLSSACAVAESALPERAPQPKIFGGLLHLIAHLGTTPDPIADLVRWELGLLSELGFGLDLTRCALTGATQNLAYVSPRTGRAATESAAGLWKERLLPLPPFLTTDAAADPTQHRDALRLTAHFLARDAFGAQNRPLPAARLMLQDRVTALAG